MTSVSIPRLQAPRAAGDTRAGVLAATGLVALIALSAYLRTRQLGAHYWIDESLSIGIAGHPLGSIPGLLRVDSSPPLYYLLLHGWIGLLGRGEAATHALSLTFALLAIPVAWWAGRSLFGRRAGWLVAVLVAFDPFLSRYAQETRMYTLVALETLVVSAAFVHAFAYRRRRYAPVFGLALVALLYTQTWGLFFALGAGLALVPCLAAAPPGAARRALARDAALSFAAAAALFAPWVPTLLFQAGHTGAPWGRVPGVGALAGVPLYLLGGLAGVLVLGAAAAVGLARLGRAAGAERTAALALIGAAVGPVVIAWLISQASPAWATRYLAIGVGPLLLVAALALARARRPGVVGTVAVAAIWAVSLAPASKSNAHDVASRFASDLRAGDLVVSTQPEQLPVLADYLPAGLRYASTLGRPADPRVMDWRDGIARLRAASPARELVPALARLPVGAHLLLVRPIVAARSHWSAPWSRLVLERSAQWQRALDRDGRWRPATRYPTTPIFPGRGAQIGPNPLRGELYTKVAAR